MNPDSILRALVLLAVANSAPVIAARLMGGVAAWPLDFNQAFPDARPILGPAKTIRGIVASVGATAGAAPLLGLDWRSGALIAAASMAGDIFSSFVKRRLRLPASSKATGLDQIPEALFGALAAQLALPLTLFDVLLTILAFFLGQIVFSRLFYKIGLRKEPY
ncbi:CDP-archaeol synthase [Rhodoblastus acidophilus]|uniref:CDP-archaeol synthase n=1 Tax=Candidatus Rhodoblastus alkanivorans TaxID=2954117 RepID=A0ABS9ZCK7_9HYPH|nr:CDP-archaeol synthase [Candidatus Rhodoblastus alkanivorans]MCI4679366.1 CDP-archaeol synthase [Candidatus Rhodoblastus alkanivorans]MCI4684842.1 CDP-archaeol synthase [Candidatus Rhodoblastus alkanivorans]MDI4642166.1 CDP-archaeol synthase [Rhodoblastus acidophilus]